MKDDYWSWLKKAIKSIPKKNNIISLITGLGFGAGIILFGNGVGAIIYKNYIVGIILIASGFFLATYSNYWFEKMKKQL